MRHRPLQTDIAVHLVEVLPQLWKPHRLPTPLLANRCAHVSRFPKKTNNSHPECPTVVNCAMKAILLVVGILWENAAAFQLVGPCFRALSAVGCARALVSV
jgi:hypothetical protein